MQWNYELKTRRWLISIHQTLTNKNAVSASDITETDGMLATKPPDEMISSSRLETLKNAAKPHTQDPAHQISVLPDWICVLSTQICWI